MSNGIETPNEVYKNKLSMAEAKLRENLQGWREEYLGGPWLSGETPTLKAAQQIALGLGIQPHAALGSLEDHLLGFIRENLWAYALFLPNWVPSSFVAMNELDKHRDRLEDDVHKEHWLSATEHYSRTGRVPQRITQDRWSKIRHDVSKFVQDEVRPSLSHEWNRREPTAGKRPKSARPKINEQTFRSDVNRYMSQYGLTQQQARVSVLRWENHLTVTATAKYLCLHRKTVDEHAAAARTKMDRLKTVRA